MIMISPSFLIYVNPIHRMCVADLINSGISLEQIAISLNEVAMKQDELTMKQDEVIRTNTANTIGLNEIRKTMAKDVHTPTETPATIGLCRVKKVIEDKHDYILEEISNDYQILEEGQLIEGRNKSCENQFVYFITPFLKKILDKDGSCIVNSEEIPWLWTTGSSQKPDLFLCPIWAYKSAFPDYKTERGQSTPSDFRFGKLTDRRLLDCVRVLDCKLRYSDTAMGELIIHLELLQSSAEGVALGALFTVEGFYLVKLRGKVLIERKYCSWTTKGGGTYMYDYLNLKTCDWSAVGNICSQLEVDIVDPINNIPHSSCAFVGAGGFGRVVQTQQKDTVVCCVKVCQFQHADRMESEFNIIKKHTDACGCNLIVKSVGESITTYDGRLCGFKMLPLGKYCISREIVLGNIQQLKKVLFAMFSLHTHDPPMTHGDARLANLIVSCDTAESLFWIDLFDMKHTNSDHMKFAVHKDITTLLNSIQNDICSQDGVDDAIVRYSGDITERNLHTVVSVVSHYLYPQVMSPSV